MTRTKPIKYLDVAELSDAVEKLEAQLASKTTTAPAASDSRPAPTGLPKKAKAK